MTDINPFDFSPENHTLTVRFTDDQGNEGSTEYTFVGGGRREGEYYFLYFQMWT